MLFRSGRAVVVLAREEEGGPLPFEIGSQFRARPVQLGDQLGVAGFGDQLQRGLQVFRATLQATPEVDLLGESVRLAQDLLGSPAVVPEAGSQGQGMELLDPLVLGLEVKDAPRSRGSCS